MLCISEADNEMQEAAAILSNSSFILYFYYFQKLMKAFG